MARPPQKPSVLHGRACSRVRQPSAPEPQSLELRQVRTHRPSRQRRPPQSASPVQGSQTPPTQPSSSGHSTPGPHGTQRPMSHTVPPVQWLGSLHSRSTHSPWWQARLGPPHCASLVQSAQRPSSHTRPPAQSALVVHSRGTHVSRLHA
ncbi:MAG: hypothetical protein M5U28_48660 [Sandaracinaceae bacterium]|nr:hypothetical protein [Sandaracinaceae bacterium]